MTIPFSVTVSDLTAVVYSAGKVFNGLQTGRIDTEDFLRSGSLTGIHSRADMQLLEDLRDVAQYVVDHQSSQVDAAYVKTLNGLITRTGALRPGELRLAHQGIGVSTRYGRHEPLALSDDALQFLIGQALDADDAASGAIAVFVALAKSQPFEDGNKRTAIFAANGYLLSQGCPMLLSIPVNDNDAEVAKSFNTALARAYVFDDVREVTNLLNNAFIPIEVDHVDPEQDIETDRQPQQHLSPSADDGFGMGMW